MLCRTLKEEIILTNTLVTPGATEIVSLDEFKKHIRWDESDDSEDSLMTVYIESATRQAENFTGRTFLTGAWTTTVDKFYSQVTLDIAPVDLTSLVVKYYDSDDALQTLPASNYKARIRNDQVVIEFTGSLPTLYDKYNAVVFEFDAGYDSVPDPIKNAIMIQAAGYFENRQSEQSSSVSHPIVYGFYQLLYPYKML